MLHKALLLDLEFFTFFTQPSEIMGQIKSYFNDKYDRKTKTTSNDCEQFLKTVDMPRLTPEETEKIDKPITKKDIYDCLQDMENDKSPGNDGLPKEFYITFFDLIVDNLIQCYNCCFEEGELTASQKQAIITLIQKPGKDATLIKSWRPISLLNVDLKLLSKILAKRIQDSLSRLIGPEQNAFVQHRYIGDAIHLISDILYETDVQNIPGILFGADFTAAFDSVDHVFMFEVLKKFGFSDTFIKWIKILHNKTESCVVNNGHSSGYFQLNRGTRQGDPLVAYLFILVIEVLV